jgi:hypothetical protein
VVADGVVELTTYVPALPVPVMAADCGEPAALSTTETEAERLAAEVGVKVTVMVQVAPAARDAPQVFVWPKLLAFVPVMEMLVMVRAALPGFDSVIGSGVAGVLIVVLGNASGFGLSTACGISGTVPVPVSVAV